MRRRPLRPSRSIHWPAREPVLHAIGENLLKAPTKLTAGWVDAAAKPQAKAPLGSSTDEVIARLLAGERAAGVNARFDASSYACPLAAAMTQAPAPSRHAANSSATGACG